MRKVELRMKEQVKYETIKKLVETNGNKKRAAVKLKCTVRNINRLIAGYKLEGKEFFVHGNRGRKPARAFSTELKDEIEQLYISKYFDCTYTQFSEFLAERENISVSIDEVRVILKERYITSPRSHKSTKKRLKKELKALQNNAKTKKEKNIIQAKFKTDKRTVFEYKRKGSSRLEEDTFTQFSYACNQLGIQIETSSVPEFKPRIERVFQTLQQRLPQELRLANITTIDEANKFLKTYIKKFNDKFALPIDNNKSVFENQPSNHEINLILAVLTKRVIDKGHSIKFNNKYFRLINRANSPIFFIIS